MGITQFYIHSLIDQESYRIKDEMTLGRGPENNIIITDDKVSGKHLLFTVKNDSLFVQDLDTRNGSFINDLQARPFENYELFENTKLGVGKNIFIFSTNLEFDFSEWLDEITNLQNSLKEDKVTAKVSRFDKKVDFSISLEKNKKDSFSAKVEPDIEIKKEIKTLRKKIIKINEEIDRIDEKVKSRDRLSVDIDDLENQIVEEETLINRFKSKHEKYADSWNKINNKIKKLESDLLKLKEERKPMEKVMQPFEDFNNLKLKKQEMQNDLKTLIRANLEQQKLDYQKRISEVENKIESKVKEISKIEAAREQEKFKERQKIKAQIAELQAKLDKTA